MGVPVESQLDLLTDKEGRIAGHSLDAWNAAYAKVESYMHALRVRNKLLLGRLVARVIDRAIRRAEEEPDKPPMLIAGEEMDRVVNEWFAAVLDEPLDQARSRLPVRGRLALLLADMPGRWQDQFLRPGPWPEEFVRAMRESYVRAGPDFQLSQMKPRPIDLGAITTLTNLGNLPYFRIIFAWLVFAGLLVLLFQLTH